MRSRVWARHSAGTWSNGWCGGLIDHARRPAPGFDRWYAHRDGGGPYYGAPMIEQGQEVAAPGYVTDAITDHAVAMLGELAGSCEPFYLEVTYTAPHSPWGPEQHPEELRASTRTPTSPRPPSPSPTRG